jgi:hypothetical protein
VYKPINLNFLALILKSNPDLAMQGFKGQIGAYNGPGATICLVCGTDIAN